ncbi:hypothetical protein [Chryseobacterium sp.]|uniref:hypothetical protein n=1 Tax=Chryseobacterium sp. TaxID=1871047 RepID=UPI002FCA16B3
MAKNLTPTEHKMLMMSMEYIANHPHVTTEAVPSNLLKFWSVPHFTDKPKYEDSSVQVLVFMFILRSYYWEGEEISAFLNTFRFNQLFFSFQIVIAATLHCRDAKLKAEPFPIFHIPEYKTPDLQDTEVLLSSYEAITERQAIRKKRNNSAAML